MKKKTIFIKTWFQNGLKKVSDIVNIDCKILTLPELEFKLGHKINFLDYFNVKSSLPKTWTDLLNSSNRTNSVIEVIDNHIIPIFQKSKLYYNFLIDRSDSFAPGPSKLSKTLNVDIKIIFRSLVQIRKLTKNTKYIMLQFKLIHQILACNSYLYTTKIRKNPLCESCNETDSIEHYIFSCVNSTQFWQTLINWYNQIQNCNIILDYKTVLLGPNPKNYLLASLIFHGKWFIYVSKLKSAPINFQAFRQHLKRELYIEKMGILSNPSNTKLNLFHATWNDVIEN